MKNESIIYFSHGKDSGPGGFKIRYLTKIAKNFGIKTESIDYSFTKDPEERITILLNTFNNNVENIFLYGSSMGSYVSLIAANKINPKGIFLCAPALYLQGYETQKFKNINFPVSIIHGWNDLVVPVDNSIRFAKKYNSDLHIINDDHSLSKSKQIISKIFENFIINLTN